MSFEEQPIPTELLREQERVQKEKDNKRLLDQYAQYIFLGSIWREKQTSEVEEFINRESGQEINNINDLLLAIYQKINRRIHWVDMGGGHGLAQRQAATDEQLCQITQMTNVDLFERKDSEIARDDIKYLKSKYPGILEKRSKPHFIKADVEKVKIPIPADLVTSIETMQYLNDPLRSIANWYNQLSDEGLMIVSTEHSWSDWIRTGEIMSNEISPLHAFFDQLEKHHVPFSFSQDCYRPEYPLPANLEKGFCNLVIKKTQKTKLRVLPEVNKIWVNPHNYKAVYYKPHQKVIEVVRA